MFSACDKTQARLPGAERIPDHMGRRSRRRHVEAPDFEDDKVGEISTIQDRCVLLKQIRSSPVRPRAARPARRPEAAGYPRVARTCDGGAESWPALAARSAGTGHDGLCPRPASMRSVFPFPRLGENLSSAERNPRVRLSETRDRDARASRLRGNVAPGRCSLLTWVVPGLKARWIRNVGSGRGRGFVSAALGKRFHIVLERGLVRGAATCFRCASAHRW